MKLSAIDLFSGIGGLTTGLIEAGIKVPYAVEFNKKIAKNYVLNHPNTKMMNDDIVSIDDEQFIALRNKVNLVAGCPPCQGFTKLNQSNKRNGYSDDRNELILQYLRVIELIKPEFIMMENVPQIINYDKFQYVVKKLKSNGYNLDYKIINVKNFGVPQSRKRLVMMGSLHHSINFPNKTDLPLRTVRDAIFDLTPPNKTKDKVQCIFPKHTEKIQNIISMIPIDGGSRKDLPEEYWLACHKKKNVGFNDVYGRMSWDKPSPTITGGCLSPSKGRFLHPTQNRNISLREASLLQTFPKNYKFDLTDSHSLLAQMIGNAIPPQFSKLQGEYLNIIAKNI